MPALLLLPRAVRLGTLAAAGGAALLLALIFAPPFLPDGPRAVVERAFALVCHRLPDRSFHAGGVALGVCHRCTGIYAGLLAGALAFPLLVRWDRVLDRRAALLLGGSLVPLGLDWTLDALGLWANTPASRVATGAVFGLAAGVYLARGIALVLAPPRVVPPVAPAAS